MAVVTVKEREDGNYYATIKFMNLPNDSPLYPICCEKFVKMWDAMCDVANGPDGLIASINAWAEENNIRGDSKEYISYVNSEYKTLLDDLCNSEEFMSFFKMRCVMDDNEAGVFDVYIDMIEQKGE
jgi:hypothetical protein